MSNFILTSSFLSATRSRIWLWERSRETSVEANESAAEKNRSQFKARPRCSILGDRGVSGGTWKSFSKLPLKSSTFKVDGKLEKSSARRRLHVRMRSVRLTNFLRPLSTRFISWSLNRKLVKYFSIEPVFKLRRLFIKISRIESQFELQSNFRCHGDFWSRIRSNSSSTCGSLKEEKKRCIQ